MENEQAAWKKIVGGISLELRLLTEAPDNPLVN
jgi:hypothetical protein